MKRNLLRLAMCLALTLALCPVLASADVDHEFEYDGINYVVTSEGEKKTAKVDSASNNYSTSVTIPQTVNDEGTDYTVTSIGFYAFASCENLQNVTIPNSVTSIGEYAFTDCAKLQSITIPNSVTSIGQNVFDGCKKLQSVTIPNSVTSISNNAFYHCESLQSVTIPNSVTSINDEAFFYCQSLQSVTIPDSVTSIGVRAFFSCDGLTNVTVKATTPPTLGYDVFYMYLKEIIVPYGCGDTYKSADGWEDYKDLIKEADPPQSPITLSGNKVEAVIKSDGELVAEAVAGSVGTLRFIWTIDSWDSENGNIENFGAYIFNFDSLNLDLKKTGHYGMVTSSAEVPKEEDTVSTDLTGIPYEKMSQTYYAVPFYKVNAKAMALTPVLNGNVTKCNLNAAASK